MGAIGTDHEVCNGTRAIGELERNVIVGFSVSAELLVPAHVNAFGQAVSQSPAADKR